MNAQQKGDVRRNVVTLLNGVIFHPKDRPATVRAQLSAHKLMIASCLIIMFAITPFVFVASSASAATPPPPPVYYVSPSGSDSSGNGSVTRPFATISHAVGIATTGATVTVEPGTYAEMVVVKVQLKLISQSSQPSNTIIDATGNPAGIVVVGSGAAGTVIEGFTVRNSNNEGIFVQDSSNVIVENNVVTHNALKPFAGVGEAKGIQLTGTSDSTVAGNTVVGNMYGGIGVADDGSVNPSWNETAAPNAGVPSGTPNPGNFNLISGNFIEANRPNHCAIVVSAYNPGEGVRNNIMSDNVAIDNQNGIIIAADTPNTMAVNNTVLDNTVLNNGEGGVIVHSNAPGDVVTGNLIADNVFNADGYLPTLEGIIVGGEGPVAVQVTTITGNTFQNEAIGIQIVNAKTTLVGGNIMETTVKLPVNGTVTNIAAATGGSTGSVAAATITTTVTQTTTATAVAQTATVTATTSGGPSATSAGGLTFSVALLTAVATLIIGLVAGMVMRPIRESAGR